MPSLFEDRWYIECDLMWALGDVQALAARRPNGLSLPNFRPWQLKVQTSWCTNKPNHVVAHALDGGDGSGQHSQPLNAVTLCGPPIGGCRLGCESRYD